MIQVKKVIFHNRPYFILTIEQWHSIGGWKGFLKENNIAIWEVKKVVTTKMLESEFNALDAWEG